MDKLLNLSNLSTEKSIPKTGPITLTQAAVQRLKELSQSPSNHGKYLRLYVESGGCSGYSYGFKFDEKQEEDLVFSKEGSSCIADPKSFAYLAESQLDYIDALTGAGFTLKNPNAKSTCGCGSSFGV